MVVFELVIALVFLGALLAAWARRMNVPYPALLAPAGAGLALLPDAPSVTLDPELALALFVAPVLLDAAFDASPRDLKENWRAITGLALVAVGLTVVAAALVARRLIPDLPWPAAVALGAVVAPPDAAAATAVLRQLRPPHRVLVILEGESLFNDATALLVYRLAVAAAATGTFSGWHVVPLLALVSLGSLVLGAALSRVALLALRRVEDVATAVILQFVSTFAVWLIAERLHLSGIVTVVVYAILLARTAPDQTPARIRIPSYAVWEVVVFVLNVLAFILVGLQLKPIVQRLARAETARAALAAVDGAPGGTMVELLRRKYAERLRQAEAAPAAGGATPPVPGVPATGGLPREPDDGVEAGYLAAQRRAHQAQRRVLSELRARGVIGDDAFHRVEEELDWAEVNAEATARGG